MMLFLLLALAQDVGDRAKITLPPPGPAAYRPSAATITAEPVAVMIAGFDGDGDGRTTRAELSAGVARSYRTVDPGKTDAIGYIAFADWAERWLGNRNAVPSAFEVDRNGDNRITLDELQERMAAIFDRFDIDRDGVLTRAELLTIRGPSIGGQQPGPDGDRRGKRPRR